MRSSSKQIKKERSTSEQTYVSVCEVWVFVCICGPQLSDLNITEHHCPPITQKKSVLLLRSFWSVLLKASYKIGVVNYSCTPPNARSLEIHL